MSKNKIPAKLYVTLKDQHVDTGDALSVPLGYASKYDPGTIAFKKQQENQLPWAYSIPGSRGFDLVGDEKVYIRDYVVTKYEYLLLEGSVVRGEIQGECVWHTGKILRYAT